VLKLSLTCLLLVAIFWLTSCSVRSADQTVAPRAPSQTLVHGSSNQPSFIAFEINAPKPVTNVRVFYKCEGETTLFSLSETDFNQNEDQLTLIVANKCAPKNIESLKLILEYSDSSADEVIVNEFSKAF
jgi:hypothetical protein